MATKKLVVPTHIMGHRHYIYAHTTVDTNEVFYIGLGTIQPRSKYARSKSFSGRNNYWKNITSKHPYTITIFAESNDYEEIKSMEKHYISVLGLKSSGGSLVNCTLGGDGCLGYQHTQSHKDFLRAKYSGKNNPMYGRKMSEEQKQERSYRMSGIKNPRYGMVGSENSRSKRVLALDPVTHQVTAVYDSIRQAALFVGVSHTSIGRAIKNKTKSKNHYWNYGN